MSFGGDDDQHPAASECWCCGQAKEPAAMVHLGNHPEVTLCTGCSYFVAARARELEHAQNVGPVTRTRLGVTRFVIEHGIDQRPIVGSPLRWLGRRIGG